MSKPFYEWIAASLQVKAEPRDGAVILADQNFEAKSGQQFFNALITEMGFPTADAGSKDPAYFTIRIAPERTRHVKAAGKVTDKLDQKKQKQWLPSNFRLKIDGLDCSKVTKIDGFTIKQAKVPGKLEFPNLKITLAEVSADSWSRWHEDFVINGKNGGGNEKDGSLECLSPNGQETLLTVTFHNLGIFKLSREKSEAGGDKASRMIAELYCERMEFKFA